MAGVKKKIRPGAIELHPEELALVVHYEVQEVLQQPDGAQEVVTSSHATKKITVKSLSERTDLPALAAEVVDKCKLIHPSKVGFVQGLLQQFQQRQQRQAASSAALGSPGSPDAEQPQSPHQHQQHHQQPSISATSSPAAQASIAAATTTTTTITRPESYSRSSTSRPASAAAATTVARPGSASVRPVSAHRGSSGPQQQLHQGQYPTAGSNSPTRLGRRQQQQRGGFGVQKEAGLVQQPQQRTLVRASEIFEGLLSGTGNIPACLDELDSYTEGLYDEDLTKRAAAADMICQLFRNTAHLEPLLSRDTLLPTLARVLREDGLKSLELATSIAGCFLACSSLSQLHRLLLENQVGTLLMDLASLELLQRTPAREAQEGPGSSAAAIAARAAAAAAAACTGPPLNDRERRLAGLVVRQDRFLYIAVATLLYLAEDTGVQRKMRKKDVVGLLAALLNRPHVELLLLAVGFLRRLCVFAENKDRLASIPGVVPQLVALLAPGCGEALQTASLRLLHNLSFDAGLRQQMVEAGLVPQAVQLLDSRQAAPVAAGLLYQLSIEDSAKLLFAFCGGALPRLYESIMRAMGAGPSGPSGPPGASSGLGLTGPDSGFAGFAGVLAAAGGVGGDLRSVPELIALAVNLAHCRRTAEWFCEGERLERLLKRSLATADELAWKLLRNLTNSGAEEVAGRLLVHGRGMIGLLQSPTTGPELFVEVLGTLASACDALSTAGRESGSSISSLGRLMPIDELLRLLQACCVPGALEEDALLEAVVLLGSLAGQPEFDEALAASGLLVRLVELIAANKADDEFVLQVCWAFSRCLMTPATTAALLSLPQVVPYLVDLLQDSCMAVRRVAGGCLGMIMDSNEAAAGTIRSLKFEAHNQEWLRLAGPEAHAIMAAAAAAAAAPSWQQQPQARASVSGSVPPGRRPAASGSADPAGQGSSDSRRDTATAHPDNVHASKSNLGPGPGMGDDGDDGGITEAGTGAAGGSNYYCHQQQQQQGPEDGRPQQLQWVLSSAGAAAGGSSRQCDSDSGNDAAGLAYGQLHAGGQRMVLDLHELVGVGGEQGCESWDVLAAA